MARRKVPGSGKKVALAVPLPAWADGDKAAAQQGVIRAVYAWTDIGQCLASFLVEEQAHATH